MSIGKTPLDIRLNRLDLAENLLAKKQEHAAKLASHLEATLPELENPKTPKLRVSQILERAEFVDAFVTKAEKQENELTNRVAQTAIRFLSKFS